MKIVIASQNPVKIQAVQIGVSQLFPGWRPVFQGVGVDSGVSAQPMGDEETLRGARNRVAAAVDRLPDADMWVGIEGGCARQGGRMWVFAWVVVRTRHREDWSRSSSFALPAAITAHLDRGLELGDATDVFFGSHNSKHAGGVIGALSHGHIDRTAYYVQPVILALMPLLDGAYDSAPT